MVRAPAAFPHEFHAFQRPGAAVGILRALRPRLEAILAVEKLRDHITPHLFITELRTIAADKLWMSMGYDRPSLAIHFTWKPEWAG